MGVGAIDPSNNVSVIKRYEWRMYIHLVYRVHTTPPFCLQNGVTRQSVVDRVMTERYQIFYWNAGRELANTPGSPSGFFQGGWIESDFPKASNLLRGETSSIFSSFRTAMTRRHEIQVSLNRDGEPNNRFLFIVASCSVAKRHRRHNLPTIRDNRTTRVQRSSFVTV